MHFFIFISSSLRVNVFAGFGYFASQESCRCTVVDVWGRDGIIIQEKILDSFTAQTC
jgi:hypothetical protein